MKLMILNLPRNFSEAQLTALFKAYGNINACNVVMDEKTGTSKGFGFVEMAVADEAAVAIEKLNGRIVEKNKIRVKADK